MEFILNCRFISSSQSIMNIYSELQLITWIFGFSFPNLIFQTNWNQQSIPYSDLLELYVTHTRLSSTECGACTIDVNFAQPIFLHSKSVWFIYSMDVIRMEMSNNNQQKIACDKDFTDEYCCWFMTLFSPYLYFWYYIPNVDCLTW